MLAAPVLLASCGDGGEGSSAQTSSQDTGALPPEEQENEFRLDPEDFGGTEINILTCTVSETVASVYLSTEFAPGVLNADPVNDAAYDRAKLLEEKYGLKITQELADGMAELKDKVQESVLTNTDSYQIVCGALFYMAQLMLEDAYIDFNSIKTNDYIDLSQPYWDQQIVDDLSVNGRTFFINGDAIVTDDEVTMAVFFNKQLAEDHHLAEKYGEETLFDIVKNGKWTMDVMYEMAKEVASDNGASGMEWGANTEDVWGINGQLYDAASLMASAGHTTIRMENGKPVIVIDTEASIDAYDKIHKIMTDDTVASLCEVHGAYLDAQDSEKKYDEVVQVMASGKALFTTHYVGTVSNYTIRNADIRYGILPSPKLDDKQEDYISTATVWWCTALAIPTTNVEKLDATCYALEALAYYGKEMITPEYYERTLKNKRFPENDDSPEMLDIIFNNRIYDAGMVYNFGTTWPQSMIYFYPEVMRGKENTHVSSFESYRDLYEDSIEEFLAIIG